MGKKLIHTDPDIMGGTPVFIGTRVPVKTLFEWLETETLENFLTNFPTVSRNQALGVLNQAEELVVKEKATNETTAG